MKNQLFQGADLIITPIPLTQAYPGKVIVVTEHAEALSSAIFQIKDEYADKIDYMNKYRFYPALGKAALAYLEKNNDEEGLIKAVKEAAQSFRW